MNEINGVNGTPEQELTDGKKSWKRTWTRKKISIKRMKKEKVKSIIIWQSSQ